MADVIAAGALQFCGAARRAGIDAFHDMKARGVAYQQPARYHDIDMPSNTGAGVILGGLAFLLGFAMVWHIWWMAIACGVGIVGRDHRPHLR